MKPKDLISVIVPVYNAEKWLQDALTSLQIQTYGNFEAILVNDGSTDRSALICEQMRNKDLRFRIVNQPNGGLSAARNTGINQAKGEWVTFLDADDMLPPDALEVMMSHAQKTGAGIVSGKYVRALSAKKSEGEGKSITVDSDTAILIGLYQMKILNSACGKLYRISIFNDGEPLRFRRTWYEDLDFFYKAFERTDSICILDRTVYFYRDNPDSFINTWSDGRLDVLDVTDRIVEHMRLRKPSLLRAAKDRRFAAHFNMLVEMTRHGIDNPQQKERCLRVIKEQRLKELTDGKTRIKNKLGALLSYFGMPAIRLVCRSSH